MPSFFSFIESFFFLSLGITFILIFLMVFHFKQRIEKLERKNNDLSDLCNKIVKEVTNLHSVYLQNNSVSPQNFVSPQNKSNLISPKEHICENIVISTSYPISFSNENCESNPNMNSNSCENTYKKIIVMDSIVNDDDDSATNIEDDEYSYDYDSNSDSLSEIIESELDNIEDMESVHLTSPNYNNKGDDLLQENDDTQPMDSSVHVLKLNEVLDPISEIQIEFIDDNIQKHNNENEDEKINEIYPHDDNNNNNTEKSTLQMNYQQMNVKNLKILAISKGLCSDTSKMKRAELIKLLLDGEQDEQHS